MIVYLFRSKKKKEHSIEIVYEGLAQHVNKKGNDTKCIYLPNERYNSSSAIIENIKYLKYVKGDIIHITGEVYFAGLFLPGKKTVMSVMDLVMLEPTHARGIKYYIFKYFWFYLPMRHVRYITCISEKVKEDILELFPRFKDKIQVIPVQCGEYIKRKDKAFNSLKPEILLVGTRKNKNIERVIEAVKGISCSLAIVGNLSQEQLVLLEHNKIKYSNYVNISNEEIYERYCAADIVCFVSTYEGFGMPIIEAQTVGRAVVTSNIRPLCDVAGDGARLVNPYDVNDIRLAIEQIINDENERESLINKGFINSKKYSMDSIAEEYLKIYKEISK